jgi:protein transport protein SEC20
MIYRITLGTMGAVGFSSAAIQSSSALGVSSQSIAYQSTSNPISTVLPSDISHQNLGQDSSGQEYESLVEHIGKMTDESNQPAQQGSDDSAQGQGTTNVDDISPEERKRQENLPRNPKKRMYETEVEEEKRRQAEAVKDEL